MLSTNIQPIKLVIHLTSIFLVLLSVSACSAGEDASIACYENKGNAIAINFININKEDEDKNSNRSWKTNLHIPEVSSKNEKLTKKINDELEQVITDFSCLANGDEEFTSSLTYQGVKIISFKYEAMAECEGMLGPFSYAGGINFDAVSGKRITLPDEVLTESALSELSDEVVSQCTSEIANKGKKLRSICPEPVFSGEFYFVDDKVIFLEFFPEHVDSPCEIEVEFSRQWLNRYLKKGSNLSYGN